MLILKKTTIQFLWVALFMVACATDDDFGRNQPCISGEGSLTSEVFTLNSFSRIAFAVPGNLLLTQGATQSVEISAQPNIFNELIVRVVNDELQIELDRCVNNMTPLEIEVTIPDIEALSITGTGSINAQNALDVDNLSLSIAGVGDITLIGNADVFDIDIAGSAEIHTFDFEVDDCQIDIAGQATVEVNVTDVLTVNIAGSGTVFYKGDPTITSNISGSGMLVDSN